MARPAVARFRANFFNQKNGCGAVFRQIPTKILTADELGLPAILKKTAMLNKGLVLVTGPTGSGKSTTLAAMIDYRNSKTTGHILTIEDPIEFVHKDRSCLISQREVGLDVKDFQAGLRAGLIPRVWQAQPSSPRGAIRPDARSGDRQCGAARRRARPAG